MPPGCAVHHLACAVQHREHTGMGQVFKFVQVGWCNIVEVRMLHRCIAGCPPLTNFTARSIAHTTGGVVWGEATLPVGIVRFLGLNGD